MKVKYIADYNTPLQYVAKGTVADIDKNRAKTLIDAGIVKAVKKGEK